MSTSATHPPRRGAFSSFFGALSGQTPTPVRVPVTGDLKAKGEGKVTRPHSLTAAAQRLTTRQIRSSGRVEGTGIRDWQLEAWEMFNEIGEQSFLTTVLASQVGKAKIFVGKRADGAPSTSHPEVVEDVEIQALLDPLGAGPGASSRFKRRIALNLLNAGEAWLVGIPPHFYPETPEYDAKMLAEEMGMPSLLDLGDDSEIDSLVWRVFSVSEITFDREVVKLSLPIDGGRKIEVPIDVLFLIRIWNEHPSKASEPYSLTRSVLPVLRELKGLTMHVSAQVDSRLAGAGLLVVPQSVQDSLRNRQIAYENPDAVDGDEDETDLFMESLIEAMTTPIADRSSASALVPLAVTVPDDATGKFQYLSFSTPLDSVAKDLRDEAIRRLALGQDAPPELLLGTGGMNHWGAWLVQEDTIETHVTPHLEVICDALTEQYLRPILEAGGMSAEEAALYSVWYDVSHMITRPNRGRDALSLYTAGELSGPALRDALGFDETDSPTYDPEEGTESAEPSVKERALEIVLGLVGQAPSLLQQNTIAGLVEDIERVLTSVDTGAPLPQDLTEPPADADLPAGDIPETAGDSAGVDEGPEV